MPASSRGLAHAQAPRQGRPDLVAQPVLVPGPPLFLRRSAYDEDPVPPGIHDMGLECSLEAAAPRILRVARRDGPEHEGPGTGTAPNPLARAALSRLISSGPGTGEFPGKRRVTSPSASARRARSWPAADATGVEMSQVARSERACAISAAVTRDTLPGMRRARIVRSSGPVADPPTM
jgi:hypothetical protein